MPKNSRKFRQKVQALKKLGNMPDLEANAIAKVTKLVRMNSKRLIIRGPNHEIIGNLVIKGESICFQTAAGMEPKVVNDCVMMTMPKPPEKKEKKVKEKTVKEKTVKV